MESNFHKINDIQIEKYLNKSYINFDIVTGNLNENLDNNQSKKNK